MNISSRGLTKLAHNGPPAFCTCEYYSMLWLMNPGVFPQGQHKKILWAIVHRVSVDVMNKLSVFKW